MPIILAAGLIANAASASENCQLETIGTGKVSAVRDGRTLALADGREVRLAAIESPLSAKPRLEALASGREVTLKRLTSAQDRYGRVVAFVFIRDGEAEITVQQAMLAGGHARVAARVGERACAEWLLAAERTARKAKLGLWADLNNAPLQAENPDQVLAERGRFTLVEGYVLSVREAGGTIYLNFGQRWSEDFTVTILKRNQRLFAAAGAEPKNFARRRVRVRGYVEERGGPLIEAVRPEQIEFAD